MAALLLAIGVLAVQPTPARADTFDNTFYPAHWGPSQYFTSVAPSSPYYRSVFVIDNTGDPSLSQHIQLLVQVLNNVHNTYNTNYPVLLYYKDIYFAAGQPCAPGAAQFIIVCKDEALGGDPTPGAPGISEISPSGAPLHHIYYAIARIRPSVVNPWCAGDKFTLVVQLISNTLGLDHNLTNPASAMYPTIPIGRCTMNGWTQAEFLRMNTMYSHGVG
jgi:hypothetical protein